MVPPEPPRPSQAPLLPPDPAGAGKLDNAGGLPQFLAAARPAIDFIVRAPAAAAARAHIPGAELSRRGEALLAQIADQRTRQLLQELCASLRECAGASPERRRQSALECQQKIDALQGKAEPEVVEYRRTTSGFDDSFASLKQSVQFVPGVGPRRAELLRRFGVVSVEDLLYHLPFRYEDRRALVPIRQLRPGESATVCGELVHFAERFVGRTQRRLLEGVIKDESGLLALTWFHQISYFRNRFQIGERYVAYGKVEAVPGGQKRITHPEMQALGELEGQGVLPVYNKPTTLSVGAMRKIAAQAVETWGERLVSALPPEVAKNAGVADLAAAMRLVHQPAQDADVDALNAGRSLGHRSIVFDELFYLQLGMLLRRRRIAAETGIALLPRRQLTAALLQTLPFQLTTAQRRVLQEIERDMAEPRPMNRLVQGDVGSGKTMVALLAALVAIESGHQAAFMAPTELLAEQHAATVARLVEPLGVRTALLTGALRKAERRPLIEGIAAGEIQLVVGTHALIQDGVRFQRLGLGVIDEQHRFGVMQRAALRRLGQSDASSGLEAIWPDTLLMTATPIPRTLAMTVYGDLDVSVIDQLPPGRKPIKTVLVREDQSQRVYDHVRRALDRGEQAYVVYPLVEGSEDSDMRDATTMAVELARSVFANYRVELVHGRMKASEKDAVMRRFKSGEVQVLVSTTVIEVGIDVPAATVMVIEHADRFGLAQLHQLRGRVGRGGGESLCILVAGFWQNEDAFRRLQALTRTNDGFAIADLDLEMRGPGELLGTRQSGLPDFRAANLVRDRALLVAARDAAKQWLEHDPTLSKPESTALRAVLAQRWAGRLELAEIG
ncbi:MAG TPA: ATP-dependent DNA helicase RecG [Terriglobales bacterium]|nr:ATP-dependent DNA helicase RecG [Terriglobales bacterium]